MPLRGSALALVVLLSAGHGAGKADAPPPPTAASAPDECSLVLDGAEVTITREDGVAVRVAVQGTARVKSGCVVEGDGLELTNPSIVFLVNPTTDCWVKTISMTADESGYRRCSAG